MQCIWHCFLPIMNQKWKKLLRSKLDILNLFAIVNVNSNHDHRATSSTSNNNNFYRIVRYTSVPPSAPLAYLPVAEAMLTCFDETSQLFIPFIHVSNDQM